MAISISLYKRGYGKNWKGGITPGNILQNQINYRKNSPIKYLYNVAKRRAKVRNIEFTIQRNELSWPEYCPLLGIKLDQYTDDIDYHGSIDRINSNKGYIPGNVMIISHRANRLKGDSNSKELALLANNLAKFEVIS